MKFSRRAALSGLLVAGVAGRVRAADWRPSRAMDWIVPFPPGGSNDIFARPVAAHVGERLGQPVVVDNRGGAGGTIGGMVAARATPDGSTLLVVNPSLTFAPIVYPDSGFDLAARLRADLLDRPRAGRAGDQSQEDRRQGHRGLSRGGAQVARHHQHRFVRPRHHPASRHRAPAAAHRHQAHPRALSRRRPGAAGPAGGPDRRHVRAAQHRGVLRAVGPPARARRRDRQARGDPARRADLRRSRRARFRRQHLVRPVRAQGDAGRHRSTCCMAPSRRRWPRRTSRRSGPSRARGSICESRAAFTDFVRHEVERWTRIAKATNIPME